MNRPTLTMRRREALSALALLAWSGVSHASGPYPQRPVRLVVPYSVGVGPDVVARVVAERLAARWGQPVVVDNRPGASGILAFSELRRTPPDGHTIWLADSATMAVNPLLHASLPYDPERDVAPLTLLFRATFALWVGGGHASPDLPSLVRRARAAPQRVSYASLGHGHPSHVAVERWALAAGLDLLHVPFKDAGAMLGAVVSGNVDLVAIGHHTVAGLAADGRLRALAVAARNRLPDLPAVPTVAEAGGPAIEMRPWAGLVTVAGTPASVLDTLRADLALTLDRPDVRAEVTRSGFELTPSTPQALLAQAAEDRAAVQPLVDAGRLARL